MADEPAHNLDKGVRELRAAIELYKNLSLAPELVGSASVGMNKLTREFSEHSGVQAQLDELYDTHIKKKLKWQLGGRLGHLDDGVLAKKHFEVKLGDTVETGSGKKVNVKQALAASLSHSLGDYLHHTLDPANKRHKELLDRFRKDPFDYDNVLVLAKMVDQLHGAQDANKESVYGIIQSIKNDANANKFTLKGVYQGIEQAILTARKNMPENLKKQFQIRNEVLYNAINPKQDVALKSVAGIVGKEPGAAAVHQGVGSAIGTVMAAEGDQYQLSQNQDAYQASLKDAGFQDPPKKE